MERYYKSLITRFLIILTITLNYGYLYNLLAPITIYISYFFLNFFYDIKILGNVLGINSVGYRFIEACIAVAAYYLLFILIIGIKDLEWKKGLRIFSIGFLLVLGMNIIRIFILIVVSAELGKNYFDAIHLLFWNFVSGIYIALVWIFLVKKFKLEKIPFYSDIKYLYKRSLLKRNKSKVKK